MRGGHKSARRAAAEVKLRFLKAKQELEIQERELEMKREELKLREGIAESKPKERH